MALEHAATERGRRIERTRISGEVIDTMKVGDGGTVRVAGRERCVTITWIGRRRVEVSYAIKSGEVRQRLIYACDFKKSDAIIGGRRTTRTPEHAECKWERFCREGSSMVTLVDIH